MAIRVAINGFGRIGRQILEAGINDKKIKWVAINDLTDTKTLAHLLKYDSVYGKSPLDIKAKKDALVIGGKEIKVFAERDPAQLPWKELDIDVVVESTGLFTKREGAMKHREAGAKKVLISAPSKDPDFTIVKGVNDKQYKRSHKLCSNASCTTNAIGQLVRILHDTLGIKHGQMITVHSYTSTQNLVDGPHKDLRRARAAAENIIPTSTGAAKAIGNVIPELDGKLDGFAVRVPTPCGSFVTLNAEVKKKTSVEKVNEAFKKAAKTTHKGIMQYSDEPLVSRDIIKNPHSCIFDSLSTQVIDGTLVSISGWYDNEWGFSCRMVDVIKTMG